MEGIWTGVRIFLAPFRGVSKWYQAQYAAVFEWVYNTKRITGEFVRALLASGSLPIRVHEPARGLEIVGVMGKIRHGRFRDGFPRADMRSRSDDGR
jgi:hypothetical protein